MPSDVPTSVTAADRARAERVIYTIDPMLIDDVAVEIVATAFAEQREGYEEVLDDHRRLVRELDVLMNGDGAATQASLCDLVAQFPGWLRQQRAAQREQDAKLCESLVGDGSKPTDRLIGYDECAERIREGSRD